MKIQSSLQSEHFLKTELSSGMGRRGLLASVLVLLLVITATSCRKPGESKLTQSSLSHRVQHGPIEVTVTVDNANPTVADQIHLTLAATVNEDYLVDLPALGPELDQFKVRDEQSTPPVLAGKNQMRQSRSYLLEPFLPGEYRIPSLQIKYWNKNASPTNQQAIATEEISLVVRSVLASESAKIHEITPPVDLPKSYSKLELALGLGLVLLAFLGFLFWRRHRQAGPASEPAIPPHTLALRALEQLLADDLVRKGEVKRFYERITDILRRYIESRFGLAAPEQTTREFLVSISSNQVLQPNHKQLLHHFLRHCDLVKFAEQQPSLEDVHNTMESCRAFIIETGEVTVETSASAPRDPTHV